MGSCVLCCQGALCPLGQEAMEDSEVVSLRERKQSEQAASSQEERLFQGAGTAKAS